MVYNDKRHKIFNGQLVDCASLSHFCLRNVHIANKSWLYVRGLIHVVLNNGNEILVLVPYPAFLYESNFSITKTKKGYPECLLRHFRQSFFSYRKLWGPGLAVQASRYKWALPAMAYGPSNSGL